MVVLLMLIPLLAPGPDGTSGGFDKIAAALGVAAVKAVVAIVGIIAGRAGLVSLTCGRESRGRCCRAAG